MGGLNTRGGLNTGPLSSHVHKTRGYNSPSCPLFCTSRLFPIPPPQPGDPLPSGEAAPFTQGIWKRLTPGRQPLGFIIAFLLALTFVADIVSPEVLHVGILFNICIGLTLWSWRPRWVVNVTAASVVLRLLAHFLDPSVIGTESHYGPTMSRLVATW